MAEYLMLWAIYLFVFSNGIERSDNIITSCAVVLVFLLPPISLILFVSRRRKEAKAKKAEKSKDA